MSLLTLTAGDLLDAFASPAPTPGGGSAAALAGALGTALLQMVAAMPRTRSNTPEERATLDAASERLAPIRARLAALVDADTAAYEAVMAAFRLPKTTESDRAARTAAIREATRRATQTPLAVMEAAASALEAARPVAACGNQNAASDVRVGLALLAAACAGAHENVRINVPGLPEGERAEWSARADAVRATADQHGAEASRALDG